MFLLIYQRLRCAHDVLVTSVVFYYALEAYYSNIAMDIFSGLKYVKIFFPSSKNLYERGKHSRRFNCKIFFIHTWLTCLSRKHVETLEVAMYETIQIPFNRHTVTITVLVNKGKNTETEAYGKTVFYFQSEDLLTI